MKSLLLAWNLALESTDNSLEMQELFLRCYKVEVYNLSYSKRVKTIHVRSKNNPIFGVILTPDWE